MEFMYSYARDFPILTSVEENLKNQMEHLVDKMLSLNERLVVLGGKTTDERARIEEEIKKTDSEIDEQVYKIYGLTEDEKAIVESSLK
jgi:predicted  nucleic acid-binding Zn-ribbon protein